MQVFTGYFFQKHQEKRHKKYTVTHFLQLALKPTPYTLLYYMETDYTASSKQRYPKVQNDIPHLTTHHT